MSGEDDLFREVALTIFLSELDKLEKGGYDELYLRAQDDGDGRQTWEAVKAVKRSLSILGGIEAIKDRKVKQRYRSMMYRFGAEDDL